MGVSMAGKFEGLSDSAWMVLEKLLPPKPKKRGKGMPPASFRCVLNTIFYVLITGCRWCDIPEGRQWARRSSSHRWLKRWEEDGTWAGIVEGVLAFADLSGQIDWSRGAIDGSFSPGARRR